MTQYIVRRLLILPITLIGVTVLIFFMISFLTPEMRSALYVTDTPRNADVMNAIIKRYGLGDPIYIQYWHWLVGTPDPITGQPVGGILRGDFGYSRSMSQPVVNVIEAAFPSNPRVNPLLTGAHHYRGHLVGQRGGCQP